MRTRHQNTFYIALLAFAGAAGPTLGRSAEVGKPVSPSLKHGDSSDAGWSEIIPQVKILNLNLMDAIIASRVPRSGSMGLHVKPKPPTINLVLNNASAKSVLGAILAQAPEYEETTRDGVTMVLPKAATGGTGLDFKLDRFESRDLDVHGTIMVLASSAKSKGAPILSQEVSTGTLLERRANTPEDALISITVNEPTSIRDILNQIVTKDTPSHWWALEKNGQVQLSGMSMHEHRNPPKKTYGDELRNLRGKAKVKKLAIPGRKL